MKPSDRIKLVSQLLDLPLIDSDGNYCGIVDDIELDGGPGK
jgi:sporulation protein YlmC with PRC-barrel domain